MAKNPTLNNGPRTVSGSEPVAKALGLSSIAAAVVTVAAWLGLSLDVEEVVIVLVGAVALANTVAGIFARRSVTPNGLVAKSSTRRRSRDAGRARLGVLLVLGFLAAVVLSACRPGTVPIGTGPGWDGPFCYGEGRLGPDGTGSFELEECVSPGNPGTGS